MKYAYCCKKHGNIYQIDHPMAVKFNEMKELIEYHLANEDASDLQIAGGEHLLFEDGAQSFSEDCLKDDCGEIERVIYAPQIIFKGQGWFTKDNKGMKYQGKHKKMMEKMREDRAKRRSMGLSTKEAADQVGVQSRGGTVVPNAQWDGMSASDQSKARNFGLRPSRDFRS